jgi:uncharacterized membrane protein
VRTRVAVLTGLTVLAYVVTVYLIFFLTYTPLNIDHVRGVQGRYFVIALPMAAIFIASMTNVDLPRAASRRRETSPYPDGAFEPPRLNGDQ